ncbi:MAG: hypothetical protein RBS57_22055, partial [Desulforhabdus sp.]|nr:hypothetical protein [Desulforhabdus sp.]
SDERSVAKTIFSNMAEPPAGFYPRLLGQVRVDSQTGLAVHLNLGTAITAARPAGASGRRP